MANAKYRDARAGFAIYYRSDGAIPLEELNELLQESGYGPVAQRTMTHYRKLLTAGFDRYISINRFDVARASRAYDNMSNLSRYKYRRTSQAVSVLFSKRKKILEAHGNLIETGDVGAIIEFSDEHNYIDLQNFKPRSGDRVTLNYSNLDNEVNGIVIACDLISKPAMVEFEYERLISLSEIENSIPLQSRTVQFKLVSDDDEALKIDVVGRRLYHFFELLEGIRALYNEAGRHSEDVNYAPPPVVSEIRVSSPATLILQLPPELVSLVSWPLLLLLLPSLRKTWYEGTLQKKEGQLSDAKKRSIESDRAKRVIELEVSSRQQEDSLGSEIINNVRLQLPGSDVPEEELLRILHSYIFPPCRALARSDVREIEITVDEDSDRNDKDHEGNSAENE